MKLLIDIGNSRLKWACLEGTDLQHYGSCTHGDVVNIAAIWGELRTPDTVYCASVASDELLQQLTEQVHQLWALPLQRLQTTPQCAGVVNGYHQPEQLGVDRWAALIAAHQLVQTSLCVVDCGSAVTIDVMDGSGQHLGGYIVPGMHMQKRSLQTATAGIRLDGDDSSDGVWGQDTVSCMRLGTLEAVAGLIERSRRRLQELHGDEVTVFITGGDAPAVIPQLDFSLRHEAHLVLAGMAWMVRELGE
jgi:type III pantothenate kinase